MTNASDTPTPCAECGDPHNPAHCHAHSRNRGGKQCGNPPTTTPGSTTCAFHGGRHQRAGELRLPPTPTRAKAILSHGKATPAETNFLGRIPYQPVDNPLEELRHVAGKAVAWLNILQPKVEELKRLGYGTDGGEQVHHIVQLYERAMDRSYIILSGIAKLNIDERLTRIAEAQKLMILAALEAGLAAAGIDGNKALEARAATSRHLRSLSDTAA